MQDYFIHPKYAKPAEPPKLPYRFRLARFVRSRELFNRYPRRH